MRRNVRGVPKAPPMQAQRRGLGSMAPSRTGRRPPVSVPPPTGGTPLLPSLAHCRWSAASRLSLLVHRRLAGCPQGVVTDPVVVPFRKAGQLGIGRVRLADLHHNRLLVRADRFPAMGASRSGLLRHQASSIPQGSAPERNALASMAAASWVYLCKSGRSRFSAPARLANSRRGRGSEGAIPPRQGRAYRRVVALRHGGAAHRMGGDRSRCPYGRAGSDDAG